jgi:hypothetical protein
MRFNFIKTLTYILLSLLISVLISILFMVWYPYNPLTVNTLKVNKSIVSRGECISFKVDGEKHYAIPVDVTVELVDGYAYFIMSYTSNNPPGKLFRERPFLIPYHIKPGKYRIRWTGVYNMNSLNVVRVKALSDEFEVK